MQAFLTWTPLLNSLLNLTGGLFILQGIRLIRARDLAGHKRAMLTATTLQGVFLVLYLIRVLFGGFTRFEGPAAVRIVYLILLGAHELLAAVQTPLILYSIVSGLKGYNAKHRRIGKITYPMWLFVSFTGPIIYVLLHFPYDRF